MLKIGLTGGIGSGKSTVADYFQQLGAPIIDADKIAHQLTLSDSPALKKIQSYFGNDILLDDGSLDRKQLREIIFTNPDKKNWLESLLHPMILKEMKKQIQQSDYPYCICVIPLLVESSKKIDFIDRVLVIDVPMKLQIKRAKDRDQTDPESVQLVIDSQSKRQERLAIADDVILNNKDLNSLKAKVEKLHLFYLSLSKNGENNYAGKN